MCWEITDCERAREMEERRNERAKYSWILVGIGKRGEINEEEREQEMKNKRENQREKQWMYLSRSQIINRDPVAWIKRKKGGEQWGMSERKRKHGEKPWGKERVGREKLRKMDWEQTKDEWYMKHEYTICLNPMESFNYTSSFSLFEWSIHAVLANKIKETSSILCHTAFYKIHACAWMVCSYAVCLFCALFYFFTMKTICC